MYDVVVKIFAILFGITLVLCVLRRLVINKTMETVLGLPDQKRQKIVRIYDLTISIWKIMFWMAPFYLLVLPAIFYFFMPDYSLPVAALMIGLYIAIVDDFLYKKSLLKAISDQ